MKEKQIKEAERKIIQVKEKELKDEIKFAKIRSLDLKKFIREEQPILRREQAKKRLAFLQQIKLEKLIESIPKAYVLIINGDFNARLHVRTEEEEDIMGKHVFGKSREYIIDK